MNVGGPGLPVGGALSEARWESGNCLSRHRRRSLPFVQRPPRTPSPFSPELPWLERCECDDGASLNVVIMPDNAKKLCQIIRKVTMLKLQRSNFSPP